MANEKRLIDVDKAKKEFNLHFGGVSHAVIANRILDEQPTVDAVEVVHAKWVLVGDGMGSCSNCHRLDYIDTLATHCRYCGAKIDGERKDNG